jgi:hypothetical protein
MATAAASVIWIMLTTSLDSQLTLPCALAPNMLSNVLATNAATTTIVQPAASTCSSMRGVLVRLTQ